MLGGEFFNPQRYLSPEPLLQSPVYVRSMAQVGMIVPSYAYAANNPLRYVDPTGLNVWIDNSNPQAAANASRELAAAMIDPEIGFAVTAAVEDPNYTIYIWPDDDIGPGAGGLTGPREGNNACDMRVDRNSVGSTNLDGMPMSWRGNFWHELGHAVELWRWENKNIEWSPIIPGADKEPWFRERWMHRRSNNEALRYENRTINGPPWRKSH